MIRTVLAAGLLVLSAGGAHAADGKQTDGKPADGDPAAGEKLARSACAMCHKLPDGSGATVGPPLPKLAADQGPFGAETIVEVLNQPQHAPAKGQVDLPADADDVAAYLNGLN